MLFFIFITISLITNIGKYNANKINKAYLDRCRYCQGPVIFVTEHEIALLLLAMSLLFLYGNEDCTYIHINTYHKITREHFSKMLCSKTDQNSVVNNRESCRGTSTAHGRQPDQYTAKDRITENVTFHTVRPPSRLRPSQVPFNGGIAMQDESS